MGFRFGLSWPEARGLMMAGAYVRRERWDDKRLFATDGGLVWVDGAPPRVVQSGDFGREEFLALDWTDMSWEQRDCVEHPGWTNFFVDESEVVTVQQPVVRSYVAGAEVRKVASPFNYSPVTITNPLPGSASVRVSGWVDDYLLLNGQVVATTFGGQFTPFGFYLAAGGQFTIAAKNRFPYLESDWVGYTVNVEFAPQAAVVTNLIRLERTYPNPFAAACFVEITGTATDAFLLNGREVALPANFSLPQGRTFSIAALVRNPAVQASARLDLEVTMSL